MEAKSYSASEWYAEFIQEWIDLSQGRAAGANFDGLVPRLYAVHAAENPREVARQEWGAYRTVSTPKRSFSFTHTAANDGAKQASEAEVHHRQGTPDTWF